MAWGFFVSDQARHYPKSLKFFVSDQMAFKTTYTQDVGNFASDQVGHYPKGLKFFVSDQAAFKTTYT